MARKLFALEDGDVESVEIDESAEIEAGSDLADTVEETNEIESEADAIEEGGEAADQLEEVADVVEKAEEEGGLEPVAAEAIRIAIEAICARVDADPKRVYALYATENFSSSSSRKANTRIALEGIKSFLEDLWERIKKGLKKLWAKVTSFIEGLFDKFKRLQNTNESLLKKVKDMDSFKPKNKSDEAPSVFSRYITAEYVSNVGEKDGDVKDISEGGDISSKLVTSRLTASDEVNKKGVEVIAKMLDAAAKMTTDMSSASTQEPVEFKVTVQGGNRFICKSYKDEDGGGTEGIVKYKYVTHSDSLSMVDSKSRSIIYGNKSEVLAILNANKKYLNDSILAVRRAKGNGESIATAFKNVDRQEQAFKKYEEDETKSENSRNNLKNLKALATIAPRLSTAIYAGALLEAHYAITFCKLSIKNQKKDLD